MKKSLKKLTVLLMAVAMVITSMSFTAFAAKDPDVTIKNVDKGHTVTLYQIVKEKSDQSGWEKVYGDLPANLSNPSVTDIAALANRTDLKPITEGKGAPKTSTGADLVWTDLDPGMYLALVTGSDEVIYNPMIVSVDYEAGDTTADAGKDFRGSTVAKKTPVPFDKEIVDYHTWANANGDTTEKGDTVKYKVETTIPSYSAQYEEPFFHFFDKLENSFKGYKPGTLKVTLKGTSTPVQFSALDNKTFPAANGSATVKEFALDFPVTVGEAAKQIVIEYEAVIDETAFESGFDPMKNEAKIEYSNNPNSKTGKKEKTDETKHYTFNIDQHLHGYDLEKNGKTSEVVKVNEDGTAGPVLSSEWDVEWGETYKTQNKPLAGAVFALQKGGQNIRYAISDSQGKLVSYAQFNADTNVTAETKADVVKYLADENIAQTAVEGYIGLDCGDYKIVELHAPIGYKLVSGNDRDVNISATIKENGDLESYSITVGGSTTTYEGETNAVIRKDDSKTERIVNTKVGSLPSTGGMGTIIFTVAGIAIMAIAAGLFIANRKNASK